MAVDTLAFVSRGVYDSAGTAQSVVNARFASWGLLGVAGSITIAVNTMRRVPNFFRMPSFPELQWWM